MTRGALLAAAVVLLLPDGTAAARGQEIAPVAPEVESTSRGASELPSPAELRALVAPAESVAVKPHAVKLESFRADTISGVYLVDSDLPSARHVAFGRDAEEHRYVWFSRRTPLRSSLVALYQVDGEGLPDVLYWRQVDHEGKVARAREFKAPAAAGVTFEYSSGPPCGKPVCEEGWQELPLERIAVERKFFEPLGTLYDAAATHGEEHLDRPVASLEGR